MPTWPAAVRAGLRSLFVSRPGPGQNETVTIMKTTKMRTLGFLAAMCLALAGAGCAMKQSQLGVQNLWREPSPPAFENGRTTQSDVMRELGPPSQVIALHDQTLFYYLREQLKSRAMILIIYNDTRETITYDRAIFIFDKDGVLTEFAFSNESIPRP